MKKFAKAVTILALAGMCGGLAAWMQPTAKPKEATISAPAASAVEALTPLIGTWEIQATWAWGDALRARAECGWGLNKQHLEEKTFVMGPKGEYQRYQTVYSFHKAGNTLGAVSFVFDGTVKASRIEKIDDRTFRAGFTPWDDTDPANIRSTMTFDGPDAYRWVAEMRENGEWKQIMDGVWKRVK